MPFVGSDAPNVVRKLLCCLGELVNSVVPSVDREISHRLDKLVDSLVRRFRASALGRYNCLPWRIRPMLPIDHLTESEAVLDDSTDG